MALGTPSPLISSIKQTQPATGGAMGASVGGYGNAETMQPQIDQATQAVQRVQGNTDGGRYSPIVNSAATAYRETAPSPQFQGVSQIAANMMSHIGQSDAQNLGPASQFGQAQYGPQLAQQNSQMYGAMGQIGMLDADLATRQRFAQGDYNRGVAGIGIDRARLDLDRSNLNTSRDRLGLDREGLGVDRNYIAQMQGYAREALERSMSGITRDERFDKRDTSSGYTSRGSWFAPFHRQDISRIGADAQDSRDAAQDQYGMTAAGYDRDLARNSLSDRNIDLSYRDLGTQEQNLSLTAQQLGLREQDLAAALESGMYALGMNYEGALYDLFEGMGGANADVYLQMFTDALANSGSPVAMQIIGQMLQNAGGVPAAGSAPVDAQGRPIPMGPM